MLLLPLDWTKVTANCLVVLTRTSGFEHITCNVLAPSKLLYKITNDKTLNLIFMLSYVLTCYYSNNFILSYF